VAARRRAGEVQLFPDGHGVLKLTQIHLLIRSLCARIDVGRHLDVTDRPVNAR